MKRKEVMEKAKAFSYWYYSYDLGDNEMIIPTEPMYTAYHNNRLQYILTEALKIICKNDLSGMTVLDCGCNSGFFSFACAKMGADHVLGVEGKDEFFRQAQLLNDYFQLPNVEFKKCATAEISQENFGQFDIVLLMGIINYQENIVGFLREALRIAKKAVIIDSVVMPFDTTLLQLAHYDDPSGGLSDTVIIPSIGSLRMILAENGARSVHTLNADQVFEGYEKKEMIALIASKEQIEGFEPIEREAYNTSFYKGENKMLKFMLKWSLQRWFAALKRRFSFRGRCLK